MALTELGMEYVQRNSAQKEREFESAAIRV